jgi:hypothetical protein
VADELGPDQGQLLEAVCGLADRFNDYQVDEEGLMNQLGWDEGKFLRIRNELEDAGYVTMRGAPQTSGAGVF